MEFIEGKEVYTLTGDIAIDNKMRNKALKGYVSEVFLASGLTADEIKLCTSLDEVNETKKSLVINNQKVTPSLDRLLETITATKEETKAGVVR